MYTPAYSRQFKRDYRRLSRSGRSVDDVDKLIRLLVAGGPLPAQCQDHALKGEYRDCRDCHAQPDLVLIYHTEGRRLSLVRLGSHAELFG